MVSAGLPSTIKQSVIRLEGPLLRHILWPNNVSLTIAKELGIGLVFGCTCFEVGASDPKHDLQERCVFEGPHPKICEGTPWAVELIFFGRVEGVISTENLHAKREARGRLAADFELNEIIAGSRGL